MGKKTGIYIECPVCHKVVYKTRTNYNRQKNHFCSQACANIFKHNETFEKRKCIQCGKEFEVSKKSNQKFCSTKCQNEWQKTRTGVKNPKFTRELVLCDWCNREFYIKQYKKNQPNKFCSSECRQAWYAAIWSQSEEWKAKCKYRAATLLSEGRSPFVNSKPQIIINSLLDDLNIKYINEYVIDYYAVDCFLTDYNLVIEVMGDYWHSNPFKFSEINSMQRKIIPRDKAKHSYILNHYNIEILYLWEDDIIHNLELCELLINEYIKNNGQLLNYNSFNYTNTNNSLLLNESKSIIFPYFDSFVNPQNITSNKIRLPNDCNTCHGDMIS